ncbi:MAG: immune inhibitor A [Chloroflexi bacterium]|nr:immune inhibitor A [Chloroflexota bacterium]
MATDRGLLLLALCWLLAATAAHAQPAPGASPTDDLVRTTALPGQDPMDLARRFGRVPPGQVSRVAASTPLGGTVGRVDRFWVLRPREGGYRQASAELRLVGDYAYWYVEQGVPVDAAGLSKAGATFDQRIYPLVRRSFGPEWLPGVDGDPRLTILLVDLQGLPGFYSSVDEYPRAVQPRSNEREMLYLDARGQPPDTPAFAATLAHELQHLIHWHSNPEQETWVDEGSAELAVSLVGYQPTNLESFERQPDTQLTAWSEEPGRSAAHYQAAFLFMRYFLERFLAPEDLHDLLATRARGAETFDRFLAARGLGTSFDEVFKDWVVANFLDEWFPSGGRFGYRSLDMHARPTGTVGLGSTYRGRIHQYGANYLELVGDGQDADVVFQGNTRVPLVDVQPPSGAQVWWSNRGDNLDSRLTRSFDLRGLAQAQLRFRLWYETEGDYDYGYVLASTDGGQTWRSLCVREARTDDPTGNNLGCGFSGNSGGGSQPAWIDEEVDLSPVAGREVLLRFEYVTDQAYNARGFLVDDVELPELEFLDDAEADAGWQSEGFIRSDNLLSQDYSVRLLLFRGPRVEVVDLPLDETRSGVARIPGLGSDVTRAVVAVSALAPQTLEPAGYTLELRPTEMRGEGAFGAVP